MKVLTALLVSFSLLLSACQAAATPTVTRQASPSPAPTATATTALTETAASIPAGCTVVSLPQTPGPTQESLFAPVGDADWIKGPQEAGNTLIVYCDFQTSGCAGMAIVSERLLEEFPADLRLVYRHFPLTSVNDKAALTMQAAQAAGQQGKFWEMHDLLYIHQQEWAGMSPADFQAWLSARAEELSLDIDTFIADLLDAQAVAAAQQAWEDGVQTGMPGTPFLLVNGEIWPAGLPMTRGNIATIILLDMLERRQFSECPPMTIDLAVQYIARLHTEKGDIVIELFPERAPLAVNNFIFLARSGWYDGVTFHRELQDFVAQAGDPSGTGYGTPGYAFSNEISDLRFDKAGLVAMANAGPDSNGSQFFITLAPASELDGRYTIFGQVIEGMEVALSLALRDPSQGVDLPPGDVILSIDIEER